jgi:hypothetical protein
MRRSLSWTVMVALAVPSGALVGGCGSGTKTVSVAGPPTVAQTTGGDARTTSTDSSGPSSAATTPSSSTTGQPTNGGTTGPAPESGGTHTAPEPAFAHQETGTEGLGAATAVVREHGFTPADTSEYRPNQTLRVLIGSRAGSGDGYGQQAFFFVNGHYIGTDSSQPSGAVRVVEQSDTEIALAYGLYRTSDPRCCPGGQATVRFQLNNGQLSPLDPIPPASSATGPSRR